MDRRIHKPGFSIIELLVVVAIMAILASVAIPAFQTMVYRSQKSERAVMMDGTERAIMAYYSANSEFPSKSGGCSYVWAWNNPWWPPTPTPRYFDGNYADWRYLGFSPTNYVRYSYYAYGQICPGVTPWFAVYAYGDLDGNGSINNYYHYFTANGGTWERQWEWEWGDLW